MDGEGIGLSRRRITLSTSGVVPMMDRCGAELGVNLAVSLHAVRDDLRDELVPLNRKYPIARADRRVPALSRRVATRGGSPSNTSCCEGVNDSEADARELVRLIAGHAGQGEPDPVQSLARQHLRAEHAAALGPLRARSSWMPGFPRPIRTPRGRDILAACGQLRTESRRIKAA